MWNYIIINLIQPYYVVYWIYKSIINLGQW